MNTTTNSNKVIKRSIILCWVALALCFLVKICGGNFFAIAVENERFIAVCEYIDSRNILLYGLAMINYLIMCYFYFNACFRQTKFTKSQVIVLIPIFVLLFFVKISFVYIGAIIEIIVMIILPALISKRKWYCSILYVVIYYIFGYVSLFVKNISSTHLPNYSLIGLIFSLDVYFMLILFMLYNRKEA